MPKYAKLEVGDPAPDFHQVSTSNPRYSFNTAAGRYIVLCFFATAGNDANPHVFSYVLTEHRTLFDDDKIAFFGVSVDPSDRTSGRVQQQIPGIRFFWDFDAKVSRLYGSVPADAAAGDDVPVVRQWFVLDPTLRIIKIIPFRPDGGDASELVAFLKALPPVDRFAGCALQAPILFLPNVFEPELCRALIDQYERHGGTDSGFMREVDGRTVTVHDYGHKRRRDCTIEDPALIGATQKRVMRRINPEIIKAHQFKPTRMERYLVACYSAEDAAHFRPHRDNTTRGTAHRRFAVSVNLNDDFDGGEVSFPEYGPRGFKAPTGGAVVFSCSLLHAVSTVTRGRRFAFLPFLYDDEAARIREANAQFLEDGKTGYKSGLG
jgi:peroxiredoxin/predicted 2-oxoglutarate/Fe(II)-dependent dioxygenase YbiX